MSKNLNLFEEVSAKLFCLHASGAVICPNGTGPSVLKTYLPLLEDVNKYYWGGAMLAAFHFVLRTEKKKRKLGSRVAGPFLPFIVSSSTNS